MIDITDHSRPESAPAEREGSAAVGAALWKKALEMAPRATHATFHTLYNPSPPPVDRPRLLMPPPGRHRQPNWLAASNAVQNPRNGPKENEKDLQDLPKDILEVLSVSLVETMDEVLQIALERQPVPRPVAQMSDIEGTRPNENVAH